MYVCALDIKLTIYDEHQWHVLLCLCINSDHGSSCLELAVKRGYLPHVQALLKAKAAFSHDTSSPNSLLSIAAQVSSKRSIPLLAELEKAIADASSADSVPPEEALTAQEAPTLSTGSEAASMDTSMTATSSTSSSSSTTAPGSGSSGDVSADDASAVAASNKRAAAYANLLTLLPPSLRLSPSETRIASAYLQYSHQELFLMHSFLVMHEEVIKAQLKHFVKELQVWLALVACSTREELAQYTDISRVCRSIIHWNSYYKWRWIRWPAQSS